MILICCVCHHRHTSYETVWATHFEEPICIDSKACTERVKPKTVETLPASVQA